MGPRGVSTQHTLVPGGRSVIATACQHGQPCAPLCAFVSHVGERAEEAEERQDSWEPGRDEGVCVSHAMWVRAQRGTEIAGMSARAREVEVEVVVLLSSGSTKLFHWPLLGQMLREAVAVLSPFLVSVDPSRPRLTAV